MLPSLDVCGVSRSAWFYIVLLFPVAVQMFQINSSFFILFHSPLSNDDDKATLEPERLLSFLSDNVSPLAIQLLFLLFLTTVNPSVDSFRKQACVGTLALRVSICMSVWPSEQSDGIDVSCAQDGTRCPERQQSMSVCECV